MKILLEGRPGVGKTTVARRLVDLLRGSGLHLAGFITEEIRERGRRVGFAVDSLAGGRGVLAHVDYPGPPTVGKYGVDLAEFERVALPALEADVDVVAIDELGKMELASPAFRAAVARLFDREVALVATVHVRHHPLTDELKSRPGVEVVHVTERKRDALPRQLAARLSSSSPPASP